MHLQFVPQYETACDVGIKGREAKSRRSPARSLMSRSPLRDQLSDGRLRTGAVLPSEAQLAAGCLVNRQSARTALRQLADGLVVRVPAGARSPRRQLRKSPGPSREVTRSDDVHSRDLGRVGRAP
jgi:DNA-binding FadR family transcriptional regulator